MDRVQIMYELGAVLAYDEVVAERVNVRMADGVATVKTGQQTAIYANPARILIDIDVTADAHPIARSDIPADRRAAA